MGWLLNTPPGLLGKSDAIGYAVCHRIDLRSFHIGNRPLALCARCTGMYLGAVLGLVFLFITNRSRGGRPPLPIMGVLFGLTLSFGIDGLNSFVSFLPNVPKLYQPHNTLRLITGTGFGFVLAVAVFMAFNQTVWSQWSPVPVLKNFRHLGTLMLLGLGVVYLITTGNPLILYPLTLVSAFGVLAILSILHSMLLLILLKMENRFTSIKQLLLPLTMGFAIAITQIVMIDLARYWLTGTWEGFHITL